jgi:hypothetical protein
VVSLALLANTNAGENASRNSEVDRTMVMAVGNEAVLRIHRSPIMDFLLDQLILITAWTHVLLAPYTKVEESFNLHATHDVLMYGVQPTGLRNVRQFF